MAILTIENPIKAPVQKTAVGIDLGTTHSLIALDGPAGIHFFSEEENNPLIPSVVRYSSQGIQVGKAAQSEAVSDPYNTFASIKRAIGKSWAEIEHIAALWTQQIVDKKALPLQFFTLVGMTSAIELSAEILKRLMQLAQQQDPTIAAAVITVPAYFNETQRQATKEAARLAGIEVLRLLNEPTAAAIAYGLDEKAQGHCLVFDLGGGTFDVSLLRIHQGVFEVLAIGGDTALGGDDIDKLIVDWLLEQLPTDESYSWPILLKQARQAKEALSQQEVVSCTVNHHHYELQRDNFEKIIEPLIKKTLQCCKEVLFDAKLTIHDIDDIILVGGSTRIPVLQTRVATFFAKAPKQSLDPDKVVAMGAAIQAALLSGKAQHKNVLLLDVMPLSVGIEMLGGVVEKILARNTPIPASQTQTFTTFEDNQTGFQFHIVQGERELAKDCQSLARFELKGLPALPAGKVRVALRCTIDADGLLSVYAQELSSGRASHIEIKPSYGLEAQQVEQLVEEAIQYAQEDAKVKKQQAKILKAQRLVKLLENIAPLNPDDAHHLTTQVNALQQALRQQDMPALTKAMHDLTKSGKIPANLASTPKSED